MAVTVSRKLFVGTWLTREEHAAVVQAARARDLSLASYLRQCAVREAARLARRKRGSLVEQLVHAVDQEA